MKIPSNKIWTQLNQGEVTGILNETQNISLDTIGQLKLARRPVAITSSTTDANLNDVVALTYFDNNYIAITDDALFKGGLTGAPWSQEVDFTPATSTNSDAITYNNRLVVTTNSNVADWDGNVDDNYSLESLTSGVPHPMAIFDSLPTYKLAVGNGNTVKILDTSYVASSTVLTLASQFIVTTLAYRSGFLYVGTKTKDGTEARVFIWNGDGASAQYEVPVGCEWVYSVVPYGESVAAVTSNGQILQISGTTATLLAAFPVYYAPNALWQGSTNGVPKVYHRGMVAYGQSLYINIEGDLDTGFLPSMKSGLWVFDPDAGLYHMATASSDTLVRDGSLSVADSVITTSATHYLKDGDAVQFFSVSGLSGVDANYVYYVKVISATSIKLALSRKALAAEKYVTITGTAGASDRLFYFPNRDNGSQDARAGAICLSSINETAKESVSSEVLWGARTHSEDGTVVYTVNVFHDSNTVGSFTTQRVYSDNIEQAWKEAYTFMDGIVTDNDSIVVKAQSKAGTKPILLSGVWSATNVINTNTTAQSSAWSDIEIGDELVLYNGKGQGKTVHVTAVEAGALVYQITIDEDYGVVNDLIEFYRTDFKKIGEYSKDNKESKEFIKNSLLGITSAWVKIKIEMRGAGVAVNQLELSNVVSKSTN